ncbi:uncharacterized protein LOC8059907 [Sorghum bicolor]|nr:uncharacterized protein LOC8059907 [Sorghum bicolor]|eukprot:XP_021310168.1 uncharacterized protein LOC8059907 [Sorghum bicolor]
MRDETQEERHPIPIPIPMAPPPPPPELIDDAIAEILLRLPPDDPACFVRASLVCKLWRRILSNPTFPDRYREFHRTPPLLGFLGSNYSYCRASKVSRFDPITTRIPFLEPEFDCRALDCRHGRVLFDMVGGTKGSLAVGDPITGDHKLLADPDPDPISFYRSGVVLCAVDGCNHRGCHGGPFVVVFVSTPSNNDGTKGTRAWVYSSETAAWSSPASLQLPKGSSVYKKRGAHVGDQIYFLLTDTRILKYDLGKHCLTTICLPAMYTNCHRGSLITMDDGSSLGFVVIEDSTLHLWARKVNLDGSMAWVQDRVVLLNNLVPIIPTAHTHGLVNVIGFAEGVDILLLGEDASGYMFDLKSGQFKKLSNPEYHYYDVFPYLSFFIPDFGSRKSPLPVETKQ